MVVIEKPIEKHEEASSRGDYRSLGIKKAIYDFCRL